MQKKETLLKKIKSLYTEIFLVSLHNRINSYHAFVDTNHHKEMSGTLHNLIDEIVEDVSRNDGAVDYTALNLLDAGRTSQTVTSDDKQGREPSIVAMTLNGLSLYFKKNKVQESDPAVEARLRTVVWDHVHSAHRIARAGDARTAKMHADIASDAMKALSHYMSDDEYNKFFNLINGQLNESTDE